MAKPIKLITELRGDDAEKFIKDLDNPKPDPKGEAILKKARNLKISTDLHL